MTKGRRKFVTGMVQLTLPMTELPSFKYRAGELRTKEAIKEAVGAAIKACGLPRETIAEELSRLTGDKISEHAINTWVAESKEGYRFPLEYAAALSIITGDSQIVQAAVACVGFKVLSGESIALFELGKMAAEDRKRNKRKRELMEIVGK